MGFQIGSNRSLCLFQMYPKIKVKVRQEEEEEDPAVVKNFQSLSSYHHHPTSNSPEHKDTPPRIRVPKSHISTSDAAAKLHSKVQNTKKPTSLLLRPRAVLSSPENDAMLATKNKTKTDHSGLKNHNSQQNRHVKCNKSYELEKKIRSSSSWAQ